MSREKPKKAKEEQDLSQGPEGQKGQVVSSETNLTSSAIVPKTGIIKESSKLSLTLELKSFGPGCLVQKGQTTDSPEGHFPSCWEDPVRSPVAEKWSRF